MSVSAVLKIITSFSFLFLLPCIFAALRSYFCNTEYRELISFIPFTEANFCSYLQGRATVPLTVATRSKAWTVFACSNTGIVCSNPTQGINICVCLFCICVVLRACSGIATDWSPVEGVLQTVCRVRKLRKRPRSKKGL
jgi:hypothetical protein